MCMRVCLCVMCVRKCAGMRACSLLKRAGPLTGVWFSRVTGATAQKETETQQCYLVTRRQYKHLLAAWSSSHGTSRERRDVPKAWTATYTLTHALTITTRLVVAMFPYFVSPRVVGTHKVEIYAKVDFSSISFPLFFKST